MIRASARSIQLADRLSDDEAKALVAEADQAGGTVVMVEIDPREGSGVIPNDWAAFLQAEAPGTSSPRSVRGQDTPKLRERSKRSPACCARNYDYDRFWVVFPLKAFGRQAALYGGDTQAEFVVRIAGREGRVRWPIPPSLR